MLWAKKMADDLLEEDGVPDCTTQENVDWAKENAPNCDGSNYDPDYVPPFMNGVGCNACGNDAIGVGEDCNLCGFGHGIDAG